MTRLITKDWSYKVFAIVISVVIWIGVAGDSELGTTVAAPIQYRNLPRDLEMSPDTSGRVHLEVRGPSNRLHSDLLGRTAVLFDLSGVSRPGERSFPVDASNTTLPAGVTLHRAVPAQVRLSFERRLAREAPVTIRIGTPPARGQEVISQSVYPRVLRIVGPESRVRQITAVETDPIDLSDIEGEAEVTAQAYLSDPQVRFDGPARVTVRVEVRRK